MGFDVKAAADRVIASVDAVPAVAATATASVVDTAQAAARDVSTAIAASPASFLTYTLAAIALMSLAGVLWRIRGRLGKVLEETMFSNWRLGLLGATGIVLSLASGYTTWDGMRNFTGEPLLSGMVTFGIQGVMLIAAWLIGESFAIGMNQQAIPRHPDDRGAFGLHPMAANIIGALVGIALFVSAVTLLIDLAAPGDPRQPPAAAAFWRTLADNTALVLTALLALALVTLYASSDLVRPYLQSARIVIKNMVLWVMFLACMATSVFFSFDSLFSTIFPQGERIRAAELRAQNQVAGLLADIEQRITTSRLDEAQAMFRTPGFQAYDAQMDRLAEASRAAAPEIERYFNDQIEARNRAVKEQQERATTAQTAQAGLAGRKLAIADELIRLKGERPALAGDFADKKADVDQKAKDVDAKRVEALAEAGGVEGSGKEGKGPMWRQRSEELAKLQATLKIAEERLADARRRLTAVDSRITQIEREQSAVDGDLAKLKGEQETAEQRIRLAQEQLPSESGARVDPARIAPAFDSARAAFRQEPTQDRLAEMQRLCAQIHNAMVTASPTTKAAVANVDCDPKQAAEAASVVFALNAGTAAFAATCKGGDKLARHSTVDGLFGFARACLADSGLTSKETDQLRTRINFVELNRDDKAHRFVVTWNAFQDGNRLAYLALAIAIAIDSLVFMSGLFGANAVRSPLSDVPTTRARSAQQLEATINAALGPMPYETAHIVLSELRPITNTDGFSAMVTLDGLDKVTADRIRLLLTAGADLRAVEAVSTTPEVYRVRSELREYLAVVVDRTLRNDRSLGQRARLEQVVAAALRPYVQEHADIVIGHLDPMKPVDGFTSTLSLAALQASSKAAHQYDARIVRRLMTAGTAIDMVAPDKTEVGRFYVRPDLYEALLMLAARSPKSPDFEADRRLCIREIEAEQRLPEIDGGRLNSAFAGRIEAAARPRQLGGPDPTRETPSLVEPRPKFRGIASLLDAFRNAPTNDDDGVVEATPEPDDLAELLAVLDVPASEIDLVTGPVAEAAMAAAAAFGQTRQDHPRLDRRLTEIDDAARNRVDEVMGRLELAAVTRGSGAERALQAARREIDSSWPILMLLPGGLYEQALRQLIEQLEPPAGAGTLEPDDETLLEVAQRLHDALRASARGAHPAAWRQLARSLTDRPASTRLRRGGDSMV